MKLLDLLMFFKMFMNLKHIELDIYKNTDLEIDDTDESLQLVTLTLNDESLNEIKDILNSQVINYKFDFEIDTLKVNLELSDSFDDFCRHFRYNETF